jgi:hypothetical protein
MHIPSKGLHKKVSNDVKASIDKIETMVKERFNSTESRMLEIIKKHTK